MTLLFVVGIISAFAADFMFEDWLISTVAALIVVLAIISLFQTAGSRSAA